MKKCLRKCRQTSYNLNILRQFNKLTSQAWKASLNKIKQRSSNDAKLASYILDQLDDVNGTEENVLKNIATVAFHHERNQPEVFFETIPLMSLSTFLSNIGGLMGMWLGLSVISVAQFLEGKLQQLMWWGKTIKKES